jgi:hypothetical protein
MSMVGVKLKGGEFRLLEVEKLFKVELTVGCLEDLCSWIEVIEFTDDT